MDFAAKKLALFDAHLSHKGLQHLVDTAAQLLGNPLYMADMSMGIACKSSENKLGTIDYSAENDPDRQISIAKQAADAGYMDWIYHHDESIIGTFEGEPRYLSARVRDGQQVLGHVVVIEVNRPFEPSDEELLPVVCQTLSFELRHTFPADEASTEYGPLLRQLLDGTNMKEDVVRKRLAYMGHALPTSLRVLVFRPVEPAQTISLTFLRSQLLQSLRHSIGVLRDNEEVHVVDGSLGVDEIEERLRATVYTGGMAIGASWSFREPTALSLAYQQADAALRLGSPRKNRLVAPYESALVPHLGERAFPADPGAMAVAILPELRLLEEFDKRDGTYHVESLAAYLNNGRSVARAAQELHVHKNSVYYRLQRISELTGLDLDSELTCFLLEFSLALRGKGPCN